MSTALFNNSDKKEKSINSYGPGWTNVQELKKLAIGYWDNLFQISILKMEAVDGGYPRVVKDSGLKLTAASSTISVLRSAIEDIIDEIKDTADGAFKFESEAVFFGPNGSNSIQITCGDEINREPGLYLVLYKGVDKNRNPEKMEVYPFNVKSSIKGFRPGVKDSGRIHKRYIQELKEVLRDLKEFEKAASYAQAHFNRVANNYQATRGLAMIAQIAAHHGISAADGFGGGSGFDSMTNDDSKSGGQGFSFNHGDYQALN